MRSQGPTDELIARMRAWDPVLDELVAMPVTSAAMALELLWIGARMERALEQELWSEAEEVMDDVRAFLRRYSGGRP